MSSEFVVSAEKRDDVAKRLLHIQDLFSVRVCCGEPDGTGSRCGDSGCILPSDSGGDTDVCSDSSTSAPVWVQVFGDSKDVCEKAKVCLLN